MDAVASLKSQTFWLDTVDCVLLYHGTLLCNIPVGCRAKSCKSKSGNIKVFLVFRNLDSTLKKKKRTLSGSTGQHLQLLHIHISLAAFEKLKLVNYWSFYPRFIYLSLIINGVFKYCTMSRSYCYFMRSVNGRCGALTAACVVCVCVFCTRRHCHDDKRWIDGVGRVCSCSWRPRSSRSANLCQSSAGRLIVSRCRTKTSSKIH